MLDVTNAAVKPHRRLGNPHFRARHIHMCSFSCAVKGFSGLLGFFVTVWRMGAARRVAKLQPDLEAEASAQPPSIALAVPRQVPLLMSVRQSVLAAVTVMLHTLLHLTASWMLMQIGSTCGRFVSWRSGQR